jgi:thimet oligopeptidase
MRHSSVMLLLGSMLGSTALAAPAIPPVLPGAPSAAAINARCNIYVARSTAMRHALESAKGASTVATTLTAYDHLVELLADASGESGMYREVSPTAASRSAGEKCENRIASEFTKLSLSRPIYERLKAIEPPADAATKLYLSRTLGSFERAGIGLDAAGRAKAQELSDKASKLSTEFEANIPKGQHQIEATPAELDGLPQDFIDAHKPGADGKITLTTDYTDYIPVMSYAKSRDLRERFYRAFSQRAYPLNEPVLRDMINTRDALAKLVRRPNYATLNFEDRMLNTPDKVQALMDEMAGAAKPAADRDYAKKLAVLKQLYPGATKIEPWDNGFVSGLVQKQDYGYDKQEARKYFQYNKVRDGILKLTEDMFGVDIRPWNTPKWDKLVESYAMYDHGKLIGRFYFDNHPRPGKYEHANSVPLRAGTRTQVPEGILVMNLPAGDALMEHDDVTTFLHEFGHLLHGMFGGQNQRWAGQSGVATEWDFVEAPSQMLENWVYDYDVLKGFATDAAGRTIPRALVDKMNRARYFSLGMDDMRQLGLSNISLQYYLGPAPADLGAAARAFDAKYDTLPPPPFSQFQDSFPHLGGYGAAYYTYRWSVVIADDMFTRFEGHGLRDRATAERYRKLVLAPGGTKPAAELVADFLGRPISIDAYRAKLAKDQ